MKRKFKIGPELINRPISKESIEQAKKRTKLLLYLGIIEYYDQPEIVYIDEYVPTGYNSIEEYEADKFDARLLIYSNKPIPKDLEQRLVTARIELEKAGVLNTKCNIRNYVHI